MYVQWTHGATQTLPGEDDPHRALDYALLDASNHGGFSKTDLRVHWVAKHGARGDRAFGLIDDGGKWLIPYSKKFSIVGPFKKGEAIVETRKKRIIIDLAGTPLRDAAPDVVASEPAAAPKGKPMETKGKVFVRVGYMDIMSGRLFDMHVERLGGRLHHGKIDKTVDYCIIGDVSMHRIYAEALARARAVSEKRPELVLMKEATFASKTGYRPAG